MGALERKKEMMSGRTLFLIGLFSSKAFYEGKKWGFVSVK